MLLRRLEAYGFKSFADKTWIEFGPGVTAIVGPNGSGKSNIADAIRWALGEQSIRSLRGTKSEDVIFSGSSTRRALGVAEISLVFDNSDGVLPVDFLEVVITRRVFRSGDSEYYINKVPCRLKDIHDLFADTGLGRESMTVISQNKIDEVLNNRPEERRLLFEEAAEITKYKQRKKEALRKIEDTEQNLQRVQDILTEIGAQLAPLAESAERTAKYNNLHNRLVSCQVTLILDRLQKSETMLDSLQLQQQTLTDQDVAINTQIIELEVVKEQSLSDLAVVERQLADWERDLQTANTDLERLGGRAAVLQERTKQSKTAWEKLTNDIDSQDRLKSSFQEKTSNLNAEMVRWQEEERKLQTVFAIDKKALDEVTIGVLDRERQIQDANEKSFDFLQKLVTHRNTVKILERDEQDWHGRYIGLKKEYDQYSRQLAENEAQAVAYKKNEASCKETLQSLQNAICAARALRDEQNKISLQLQEQEKRYTAEFNQLNSRQKVLSAMQREYEGFGRGIKSILKSDLPWRSGICGAAAELITVDEQYVVAIEVALGNSLQHIVTDNDQVAKAAIAFLKNKNLGRATFLPLNTIQVMQPRPFEKKASEHTGSLGFAASLVQCEPRYRRVVDFLLGRTVVAATLEEALVIAKQSSYTVRIVTLDGEIVHPGGSLAGGSTQRRETSFLSRANEVHLLQEKSNEIHRTIEEVRSQIIRSHEEIKRLDVQAVDLEQQRNDYDIKLAQVAIHIEKLTADKKRLLLSVETLQADIACEEEEKKLIAQRLFAKKEELSVLEGEGEEQKLQTGLWQEELKVMQQNKEKLQNIVTERKIQLNSAQQHINAAFKQLEQLKEDVSSVVLKLQKMSEERIALEQQLSQTDLEIAETANQREVLQNELISKRLEQDVLVKNKMSLLVAMQKNEKELKDFRRKRSEIQGQLNDVQLRFTKCTFDRESCVEQLRDRFHIERSQAETLFLAEPIEQLRLEQQDLERSIASLGAINPQAIEEYSKLQERHQFLQVQYNDLTEARASLFKIIGDIDQTMGKQFQTAFKMINELFGDIFTRLFGGGQAHLELAGTNDLLTAGIEIIVQPPGKKQQNLSLLSGGERALTVIALLFAFLAYRPAPFCVVDEIDAALDEANVQRFSEFLRGYARNTQFIIVTHRKGTMEVADVMHGITMEEAGVTRLVSVKFMDQAG
ncbi:MAG: chromosome segregation protein [Firmicutes bacterium]|nr:chromosome segregation protein [Bacillota bacterium]